MNLNDIVLNNRIGNVQNDTNLVNSSLAARNAAALELIDGLRVGDNLQAQIVGKDGNIVSLQLPNGSLVDARLSSNIGLDIGKLITFEVKGNGQSLSLSPLFTNLSSDPNISKAINMAGLPLNESSAMMTKEMMQSGMNIDRNSLSAMYKDVSAYSGYPVEDIVDLHKLGIEVNEDNLKQIDNYKNLSYQIGEGMNEIANGLKDLLSSSNADTQSIGKLMNELIRLAVNDSQTDNEQTVISQGAVEENQRLNQNGLNQNSVNQALVQTLENQTLNPVEDNLSAAEKALRLLSRVSEENITQNNSQNGTAMDNALSTANETNLERALVRQNIQLPTNEAIANTLKEITGNDYSASNNVTDLLTSLGNEISKALSDNDFDKLSKLIDNPVLKDALLGSLEKEWSITPSQVADKEQVKDLYNKLTKQLKQIEGILNEAGVKDTPVSASVSNMSSNIDFLNQINQMYAYVQLPIRLSGGNNAHGDLYVYSNGKKLTGKEGKVSALLHLDMDNLGPVDVYVAMDNTGLQKKVSTQFYVADDSILDFLNEHMDELTSRLEKKGYAISAKLSVKDDKKIAEDGLTSSNGGGINGLDTQRSLIKLSEYSFDVRT